MSQIIGINQAESEHGTVSTTLQLASEFDAYYDNPDAGRTCEGLKAESVYVGSYDCSKLKVGQEIEIFYDKAITTAKGTFQPVKKIEIVSKQ